MTKKLVRLLTYVAVLHRPTLYVACCGVTSLIAIPILATIPDGTRPSPWPLRIFGYILLLAFTLVLVRSVTKMLIPPRPHQPSIAHADTAILELAADFDRIDSDDLSTHDYNRDAPTRHLSSFARRRIAKQHPGLENSPVLIEASKSKLELFFQLEARQPRQSGKESSEATKGQQSNSKQKSDSRSKKRRARAKYMPGTTLYDVCLTLLVALALFVGSAALALSTKSVAVSNLSQAAALVCFAAVVVTFIRAFHKWSRWYYWRLVVLGPNPDEGFAAKVVIIDKPLFFPGGSLPSIDLADISLVSSSTARTLEEEQDLRSIAAGSLGVEWLIIDTDAQNDKRFNWIGPFRNTPTLVSVIDKARTAARHKEL